MKRDELVAIVRANQEKLRRDFAVGSLVLFGSLARDEAGSSSDVDMLVEFTRPTGYFGLVSLQLYLEQLLGRPVDLGTPNSLRPAMRRRVEREAIRVA